MTLLLHGTKHYFYSCIISIFAIFNWPALFLHLKITEMSSKEFSSSRSFFAYSNSYAKNFSFSNFNLPKVIVNLFKSENKIIGLDPELLFMFQFNHEKKYNAENMTSFLFCYAHSPCN